MISLNSSQQTDRGISEVLSFVFVFALIISTLSVTFIVGIDKLENQQEQEATSNIERSLILYNENVRDLINGEAKSRTTELRTQESTIGGGYETSMRINVENADKTYASNSTVFMYKTDYNVNYVQEFGAILKLKNPSSDNPEVIMLHEPKFIFTDDFNSTSFHMVETRQANNREVQSETVLVRKTTDDTVVITPDDSTVPENMTVTLQTPNYEFWEDYLSSKNDVDSCTTDPSEEEVTCELNDVEDYSISYTAITFEYEV